MSVKRIVDYASLIVNGDLSDDITGPSTNILYTDRVSFQLSWTGDAEGDFTVEGSNDESVWVNLPLSPTVAAAGSADDAVIEVETALKFIRLKFTHSSGTGTLQAHIVAKSISG